ncbi:MAG: alanine dehydrogenase [Bacillota bacterium]|nr:alanine dehydrogenase [Bacillota bacterium]
MIIGIPKEIKNDEYRVALTPAGVEAMRRAGHEVYIEQHAGTGSGFSDGDYRQAGAEIMSAPQDIFAKAEMIMKVKEPLPAEYGYFRPGQILFTFLHLAPERQLTQALLTRKVTGIAYETVESAGVLPLLTPMSEIAGRLSIQAGAQSLERSRGGKGILLGGVPGVAGAQVVIVGGGTVGINAARMAAGLGARVTILDISAAKMRYVDDIFQGRVQTVMSDNYNLAKWVKAADLLIGAVLVPGARAPKIVTEAMVKAMERGAVIVDVAIDQGGCVETMDHATTHSEPTYIKHGVVHYAVANMPGAVPRTATFALTNATLGYALQIAGKGWKKAVRENDALAKGLNVLNGQITYRAVAEAQGRKYIPWTEVVSAAEDLPESR